MTKYEILQLRKLIADAEFAEQVTIDLNSLNVQYAQDLYNIERLAQTVEEYELLTSALWEAYTYRVQTLKDLCIKRKLDKGRMIKIFGGVAND